MNWFESQIEYARLKDDEILSDAYRDIIEAVTGRKLQQAWQNESRASRDALSDICRYFRIKQPEIPESIEDLNAQLDYVLKPCSVMRRTVKLKKGWHRDAVGVMLGVYQSTGTAIALIPREMGGYGFLDPATGKMTRVTSKNERLFDEEALLFYRPFPLKPMKLMDLMRFMRSSLDLVDVFWYIGALLIATLLGLFMPKLTNLLFSDVLISGSVRLLVGTIVFMASLTVTTQIISGIQTLILSRISDKLDLAVESASMMRLFSLPVDFFRSYTSAELTQYVTYLNQICETIMNAVFSTGLTGVFSLLYVTQIFRYAPSLVVPALLITVSTLVISMLIMLLKMRITKQTMDLSAKEQGMLYSAIAGIQKIRLCGAERRVFARWGSLFAEKARLLYSPPKLFLVGDVITAGISLIGTVILYYQAVRTHVSVANYYSFMSAYAYISSAFAALLGVAQVIAGIKPILQIVKPLLDAQPEIESDKEVVTRLSGRIDLEHVSFRYPDADRLILNDLSLRIKAGEYVAIVGESGCGKSTLMRILLGFEKPEKGAVSYDGRHMDRLDLKSLRRKIGVVMQNGKLVWGDLYSNITISAPWLTLDDAWRAAEIADIADYIRSLPMGMNTIVQEGSGGFSGGQKQRLMIARAVAPKPSVLFLDEATSALDNITQKKISESLEKLRCTRIVIAHRLSTIQNCDRILYLKDGKIVEEGTFAELTAKNGLFAELVRRQMVTPD